MWIVCYQPINNRWKSNGTWNTAGDATYEGMPMARGWGKWRNLRQHLYNTAPPTNGTVI